MSQRGLPVTCWPEVDTWRLSDCVHTAVGFCGDEYAAVRTNKEVFVIDETSVSCERISIDAPAEMVWSVIVDFDRYGEWNEFCPQIEGEPKLGAALTMKVDLGRGLQEQVEYITFIDAPRKIVWSMQNRAGDPIHANRSQLIESVDESHCTYWSIDEFQGDAVAAMMKALAKSVEHGFELCARGLKREAERRYRESA